jgi:GTP-binding protein HflX
MQKLNFLTDGDLSGKTAAVITFRERNDVLSRENARELQSLCRTLGIVVTGAFHLRIPDSINPATYIGSGKVQQIKEYISANPCACIVFEKELTPVQQRNLEAHLGIPVIDRTGLILLIFGLHAHTIEGKLQVELAQLNYILPRLAGSSGALSRLGGTVGTRGPGEQKLEISRRRIRERVRLLERRISEIEKHRKIIRETRERKNLPVGAIVGYTNVGKSTLLNALIHRKDASVENKLFSTLDPLTRAVYLGNGQVCLLSDTVGLLSSLPHHLIAAFKATLEELRHALFLILLFDATGPFIERQRATIREVLEILEVENKPIIEVFNKIDLILPEELISLKRQYPEALFVSASTCDGLDALRHRMYEVIYGQHRPQQGSETAAQNPFRN